jgi:hypothetical protein
MIKTSDYKIAKLFIESACTLKCVKFIDLPILFDDCQQYEIVNDYIKLSNNIKWKDIVYNIVDLYFTNFEYIFGIKLFEVEEELNNVMKVFLEFLNIISIKDDDNSSHVMRLYQFPLMWILMKDLICPAFSIKLKNVMVFVNSSLSIDIANYIDTYNSSMDENEEFICINKQISYAPIRDAFFLLQVLAAHEVDPYETIRDLLNSEICDKLQGLLSLSYKDKNDIDNFMAMLKTLVFYNNNIESIIISGIKVAQVNNSSVGNFWFFGLLEQMLENSRGSDWSTYKILQPFTDEIKEKIEHEKAKAGKAGLSYEALLRVKSGENGKEQIKLIERKLDSDRIW